MQIETPRLLLRDFKQTDWKDVHEYATDLEVVKYMEWGPNSSDETIAFVDHALDKAREKPRGFFEFAVIVREEGKLIGACGLRVLPGDKEQADIGYCYNRNYWHKGYATEASRALVNFGFGELKLHRIHATCDAENLGSARVLKNCSMRQEAHLKEDKKIKGRWRDTFLFAILEHEWHEGRHDSQ